MKLKKIALVLSVSFMIPIVSAANKTPLSFGEYMAMLGVHGQGFSKMDYERKKFENNERPYTSEEDTNFNCNAILLAKESLNFINQYPEYKQNVKVQTISNTYQNFITTNQQKLVRENKECKGQVVRLPTSDTGAIPLNMTSSNSSQLYQAYYQKRDNLVTVINTERDSIKRKKAVCELTQFSTNTEMNILLYQDLVNSSEGKKLLSTINQDRQTILKPKSIADRC